MDSKYIKLREILEDNDKWPMAYMFKFIAPNKDGKVQQVVNLFPVEAKKSFKHTKNLKYVSVTCVLNMNSADEIISITEAATDIEGVIMV